MGLILFIASIAIAILALAEIAIFTSRFSVLGAWLILTLFLWESLAVSLPKIGLGPAGMYPQDIVFVILMSVGLIRLIMRNKLTYVHLLWLFFGLLITISFIRGVFGYGVGAAGVELREFFYFFAGALYFMTFPASPYHLRRLTLTWLYIAGVLFLIALFRWAAGGFGLPIAQQWMDVSHGGLRVLNATQAYFLAEAFLVGLFFRLVPDSSRFWRSFIVLLLPVIVLLQHRTVWVIALVSVILAALGEGKIRGRVVSIVAVGMVVGVVLGLAMFGDNIEKVPIVLGASTTEAVGTDHSTLMWRVEGWEGLLGESNKLEYIDYLFGKPFGAGYVREVWGQEAKETPHNYYVQTFLRLGAFGLITLILTYAILLRAIIRSNLNKDGGYFDSRLMYILLITQLIYFITYSPHYEQGIILGLATAIAAKHEEEQGNEQVRYA